MNYFHIISRSTAKENGVKNYFTGKPCINGHIFLRRTTSGICCYCSKIKNNKEFKSLEDLFLEKKTNQRHRGKKYYLKNINLTKERSKKWKKDNPEKVKKSFARWRGRDSSKAITFMRDSLRRVMKIEKNGRTEKILGYTRQDLIKNIESKFTKGMSWSNHGKWHIDHIKPISAFLAEGIDCPKIINSLDNLQPLWKLENLKKGSKYEN